MEERLQLIEAIVLGEAIVKAGYEELHRLEQKIARIKAGLNSMDKAESTVLSTVRLDA